MKVVILNYSGSVGKTVIASHLLAPRMNGSPIFAVESTNETAADLGLDIDQMRGEHFGRLFRDLLTLDDAIIDVGASNIEDFLDHMNKYEESHEEIDHFVLPVINTGKAQRETIKTVNALAGLGVDPERIRVLFNRVDVDVHEEFAAIFGFCVQSNLFQANPDAVLYENEVFDLLSAKRMTIADVLADTKNYRQLLREADRSDQKLISHLTDMHSLRALTRPVNRQLDSAFNALFA